MPALSAGFCQKLLRGVIHPVYPGCMTPQRITSLPALTTPQLVAEYERLMINRHDYSNGSNPAQRQKRINRVVDLISDRADADDADALAWFDAVSA